MKKIISVIIVATLVFSLCSCRESRRAYDMLSEFVIAYGAEGVIYSPDLPEGDRGYLRDGLVQRAYVFSGRFPENFAVFLNSRTDSFAECGVFVCEGAEELSLAKEASLERIRLLAPRDDRAFVKTSGRVVFYSTLSDRVRAERIWREIIR